MDEISYEELVILLFPACSGLPPELEVGHNRAISTLQEKKKSLPPTRWAPDIPFWSLKPHSLRLTTVCGLCIPLAYFAVGISYI